VAPAPDGAVWFSGQSQGFAGRFDPKTGQLEKIPLGPGAAPHGVIVGPDGNAWLTEGGQNAIARVDAKSKEVKLFPLPKEFTRANLNTLAFGKNGIVWFTGQNGIYGRADPRTGRVDAWKAPKGPGPYGIAATPSWRRLVRIARRRPYRKDRYGDRRSHGSGTTEAGRRAAPHLVGFQRHAVGELLARRSDRAL
jgi:streptogramin lyase